MRLVSTLLSRTVLVTAARIGGHYALALIAISLPEVGENRFLVAGLLAFVFAPMALLMSIHLDVRRHGAVEPMVDMVTLLIITALMPDLWFYSLIIGVVVALAPSIAANDNSHWYYAANSALLIVGMTAIATYHQLQNWLIPIAILLAVFPSTVLYSLYLNKRTQEIKRRADSLTALQLVSGGIAHDFNNILTSIAGYAEVARTPNADAATVDIALERIVDSTDKASRLTRQLIMFAGNKPIAFEVFDVVPELTAVVQMVQGSAGSQVDIELDQPSEPVLVLGDAGQLSQVMLNLLVNAVEAILDRGCVKVSLSIADNYAVLIVKDDGVGMTLDQQRVIFDPFVSAKPQGHGLGLAVVKNIVDAHQGHIELTSQPGRGATFEVSLPLAELPPQGIARKRNTILIADDEQPIRGILRQVLELEGFQVIEAVDGNAFTSQFSDCCNDLAAVVLDVKMPGKPGWQCLDVVRSWNRDLPVLMISGYDPEGIEIEKNDPATNFLPKPFKIAEVKKAIGAMVKGDG